LAIRGFVIPQISIALSIAAHFPHLIFLGGCGGGSGKEGGYADFQLSLLPSYFKFQEKKLFKLDCYLLYFKICWGS